MFDVFDDHITLGNEIKSKPLYTLYKGTQRVVDNISRPVVIKKITNKDSKKIKNEIELLANIGKSPFISSVLESGGDKEGNGWVVFEQYNNSVKDLVTKKPAELSSLTLLISQMLQAFRMLHERETPIIYNPLQPENIINNPAGSWLLSSYSLELEIDYDEILNPEYAKYMAPESFDAESFSPSVQSNLYSLGMVIYEYALGRDLFMKQFQAVYNHNTNEYKMSNTLAERWMYWHTSTKITLPTLKELIPSIPEDLSKTVALMLCKDKKDRAKSAQHLFEKIVRPDVNMTHSLNHTKGAKNKPLMSNMTKIMLVILLLAASVGVGAVNLFINRQPKINVALDQKKITTKKGFVKITGQAKGIPKGARIMLELKQGLINIKDRANYDKVSGKFVCLLELPSQGDFEGLCAVLSDEGSVLFVSVFTVNREAPENVNVKFVLKPDAVGAIINLKLKSEDKKEKNQLEKTLRLESDSTGQVTVELPYGDYNITVNHPYYRDYDQPFSTGIKAKNTDYIQLVPLSDEEIEREKLRLQYEYQPIQDDLDQEDPDLQTLKKMAAIQKKLSQLIQPNATDPLESNYSRALGVKRRQLENQLKYLNEKIEKNDLEARKKYAKLLKELSVVNNNSIEAHLRDLKHKRDQLLRRVANGDYSAKKKLEGLDESLRDQGIDPNNIEAGLSSSDDSNSTDEGSAPELTELERLQKEREELLKRAANGDPEAIAALKKLDAELKARGIDPDNILAEKKGANVGSSGKKLTTDELLKLNKEREELLRRAANGDPEAIAALKKLDEQLKAQGLDPDNLQDAITDSLKTQAGRDLLMANGDNLDDLEVYTQSLLPSKALKAKGDGVLGKIVVTGYVFDTGELMVILKRLEPIQQRLEVNLIVDPNKIKENLSKEFEELGVEGVRVHPFLIGPQYRLYIGVPAEMSDSKMKIINQISLEYVSSSEAVSVERFAEGTLNEE